MAKFETELLAKEGVNINVVENLSSLFDEEGESQVDIEETINEALELEDEGALLDVCITQLGSSTVDAITQSISDNMRSNSMFGLENGEPEGENAAKEARTPLVRSIIGSTSIPKRNKNLNTKSKSISNKRAISLSDCDDEDDYDDEDLKPLPKKSMSSSSKGKYSLFSP